MKIRIEAPKVEHPGPHTAHGTRIFLGEQELRDVGDITVRYPVRNGPVSVEFSVLATEELSLEANAEVHITVQAIPGYEIHAIPGENGVIQYSCCESEIKKQINKYPGDDNVPRRNIDPWHRSAGE